MAEINLGRVVGYSAYEIAVQQGFNGTEEEWIASLKGEPGQNGSNGLNAINPFKGWWPDLETLKAAHTATQGDSAYVKDVSPATTWSIYIYSASAASDNYWADSGTDADTSNVQQFASGENVNEVHIVKNFHGGVNDVLSAEQGKKLANSIFKPKSININSYQSYAYYLSSANTYVSNSNAQIRIIEVTQGKTYKITTQESAGTSYAFITNDSVVSNNKSIPCCSEYPSRIVQNANTTVEYDIPDDCYYLVVMTKNTSGGNIAPTIESYEVSTSFSSGEELSEVRIVNDLTTGGEHNALSAEQGKKLAEKIEVEYDVLPELFNSYKVRIVTSTMTYTNDSNASLVFIPVVEGDVYYIAPSANNLALFCFVSSRATSGAIPTVAPYTSYNVLAAGSQGNYYTIPSGCYYIALQTKLNNNLLNTSVKRIYSKFDAIKEFMPYDVIPISSLNYSNSYSGIEITNTDKFLNVTSRPGFLLYELPQGSYKIKINNVTGYISFFTSNGTPVNGQEPPFANRSLRMYCANVTQPFTLQIPENAKYLYVGLLSSSYTYDIDIFVSGSDDTGDEVDYEVGEEIMDVEFNDTPDVLFTNHDQNLPSTEGKHLSWSTVLKISENMYYMYYNCLGVNDSWSDQYFHLALAWSTDGVNWNKSIPSGITPPITGTNLLFNNGVFGMDVVKVQDNDFPYRMVGFKWHQSSAMYKSADGVNWTKIREYPYYYDTQCSLIVRGEYIKIYMRMRDGSGRLDRYVGIVTSDLDGNVLTPPTILFGKYLYNSAASAIDYRREILFPTFFNTANNSEHLECYIVDNDKIYKRDTDFSNIISNSDLSMYVSPHIINIGNEFYLYYAVRDQRHDGGDQSVTVAYKRAKVTFNNRGYHWYPQ